MDPAVALPDIETSRATAGVIVRDSDGNFLAAISKATGFCLSAKESEALAFLTGVESAKGLGLSDCTVEGDAKMLISEIQSRVDRAHPQDITGVEEVVDDILHGLNQASNYHFAFTGRNGNKAAHLLADYRKMHSEDVVWSDIPPD